MTSLIRSVVRASSSRSVFSNAIRCNSTLPSPASSSARSDSPSYSTSTDQAASRFPRFTLHPLPNTAPTDRDGWWRERSKARSPEMNPTFQPASLFAGRSFNVSHDNGFLSQYKRLARLMKFSGMRKDIVSQQNYEKPSVKRLRVGSERHRRRFKMLVRQKVKEVQLMRSR